ncbi:MAG: helical backbone metal receptor [Thermodesulfobacteriota bacterium]
MHRRLLIIIFVFFIIAANSYSKEVPQRIVSISPNLTQVIFGLGAGENIVGVTIYDEYPKEVVDLPKIGGWVNPNYEAVLALKPDLVVLMKDQDNIFGQKLRDLGLNTFTANSNDSIQDILETISDMGRILDKTKEAKSLSLYVESNLEEIREKTKNVDKKRVLIVVGRNPGTLEDIYVIGTNNYIDELVTLSGGSNVVEHERNALKISKESVLNYNPEVIVEINHEKVDREEEILEIWSDITQVDAVKNNQVYVLSSKVLLHPSQRIVEGAKVLTEVIHPELTKKYGNNN